MPYFDRFDVCEAYLALEMDWNIGGRLVERGSYLDHSKRPAVAYQLHRMYFRPSAIFQGYDSLTENGQAIYNAFLERHRMCSGCDGACWSTGASCDQQVGSKEAEQWK